MNMKTTQQVLIGLFFVYFLIICLTLNEDNNQGKNYVRMMTGRYSPEHSVSVTDSKMYEIVGDQLFHDRNHFIQGLTYSNNVLYESVGMYSRSQVCRLDPNTGQTMNCVQMDKQYFAEGMQVYGDPGNEKLIQLTWKSQKGFIRDANTLEELSSFMFNTTSNEGWGICFDKANNEFIVSDGSPFLHFWNATTLEPKREVEVKRQNGDPAERLNELEFVDGKILANVWYSDVLLVIDPATGKCENEYDFSMLYPNHERSKSGAGVFNGISVSGEKGVIYVTGKNWDRMFKVKLLKKSDENGVSNLDSNQINEDAKQT